jgi:hypothetical protein
LPLEAATVQALLSDEDRARTKWSNADELSLVTLNLMAAWRYEWLLANTAKADHHLLRRPEPLLHPWESLVPEPEGPPRFSTKAEVAAFFGGAVTYTKAEAPAAS